MSPDRTLDVERAAAEAVAQRTRLAADPHRPRYHFLSPANWLNDPNGLIQWRGEYHLFYQYNPHGAFSATKHWGHARSRDLVHWEDLPIALAPAPGTADQDGCYSGCIVDNQGVPTMIYTGVRDRRQRPCVAVGSGDLLAWEPYHGNPVIPTPPPGLEIAGFRDHTAWREGDTWYQLVGSGIRGHGGAVLLYRSDDLYTWEYLHPMCVGDHTRRTPVWTGVMWECPDFFALEDSHVLIVSVFDGKQPVLYEHLPMIHHAVALVGDYAGHRFTPTHEALVDHGHSLYAPQSFTDEQGRRIMFGWLREERTGAAIAAAGWSGAMSLPRVLSLSPEGRLHMAPAPEVATLRGRHVRRDASAISGAETIFLDGIAGDMIEISLDLALDDASTVGLCVRCSPDGTEETRIVYDRAMRELSIDRTRSSLDRTTRLDRSAAPLRLEDGETLRLRVFVDHSIVEVFAEPGVWITSRVYPTQAESTGVRVFADGTDAQALALEIWEMMPIWP
jgi:beta-fructofuranosidase